ncbi:hypothetical protein SAMN05660690_3479 [Geodermatophilus telluris]|uniref:Uncharacterized protein n=2 Tax=Geodermatophilus telluris TaxID=1190417 RepID=A0A1G6S967_9ACTN|nr:hypothetical protein SAMN05660690_3479 [Geodermatophilus telluris]
MYVNLEQHGVAAQRALYARAGDQVIDVYVAGRRAGRNPADVIGDMTSEIERLGPATVSKHTADPRVLNVIDVAPGSVRDRRAFESAVRGDQGISRFLTPSSSDPAYHLEIPQ